MSPIEYNLSRRVTKALYSEITVQKFTLTPIETHELIQKIKQAKQSISHMKTQLQQEEISRIRADSSNEISHSRPLRGIIVTHSFTSVWIQAFHRSSKERNLHLLRAQRDRPCTVMRQGRRQRQETQPNPEVGT